MKQLELRQLIREEIQKVVKEWNAEGNATGFRDRNGWHVSVGDKIQIEYNSGKNNTQKEVGTFNGKMLSGKFGADVGNSEVYFFSDQAQKLEENIKSGNGKLFTEKELKEKIEKEYIVWGIPPGKREEEILFTKAKSKSDADKVCNVLEKKHGCKKCRVQILDLSTTPDFTNVFNEEKLNEQKFTIELPKGVQIDKKDFKQFVAILKKNKVKYDVGLPFDENINELHFTGETLNKVRQDILAFLGVEHKKLGYTNPLDTYHLIQQVLDSGKMNAAAKKIR